MVGVVEVGELHLGADLHRQQAGIEREVLLAHLPDRQRGGFRESAFEINHGQRRVGGKHAALVTTS